MLADEPYRLFFPVALLAGVFGVMLWPMFYAGQLFWIPDALQLSYYPNLAHAHLMIQGYVGGFAIGFIGTAMPKLLKATPLKAPLVALLFLLHLGLTLLHLCNHTRIADGLFAAMLLLMLSQVLIRLQSGKLAPPPGMVLAGMGLLSGALGAGWLAAVGLQGDISMYRFAQRLLYQAFILLPLMGIGAYIFPMILNTANKHAALNQEKRSRAWKLKFTEALILGCLILASYWVDSRHPGQTSMPWVRFLLCAVWLSKECGWLQWKSARGIMPWALRSGILCLLCGLIAVALIQRHPIALDHSLYIGGFGLITMIVATRVIYGHSGQGKMFQRWVKPLCWCTGLLLFDMLTRVSADFMPWIMVSHHVYAALLWVVVSIIWGIALLPSVRKRPFAGMGLSSKPTPPNPATQTKSLMDMDFRK